MSLKKVFFAVTLFAVVCTTGAFAQTRWLSRYWDGCKPTCAWREHAGSNLSKVCGQSGTNVLSNPADQKCAKDGGPAYSCWDQIPFVDPNDANLAYGFGATSGAQCGTCFEVTFDGGFEHGTPYATHAALKGKKVIIMGRNTGSDVGGNQIDFAVPGGGLGQFDCFTQQIGHSNLGQRSGGLLADCETELRWANGTLAQYQTCLKNKCDAAFNNTTQTLLRQGCNFYANFMMAANNPTGSVRTVSCPQLLVDRYGGSSIVQPPGGGTPNNPTLTLNRNPTAGGNVSSSPSGSIASGTSVTVTASPNSGYSLGSWSGAPTGATTSGNTLRFNMPSSNTTITANFTTGSGGNPSVNLIQDGNFPGNSLPVTWRIENETTAGTVSKSVSNGRLTLSNIQAGADMWEPQLVQSGLELAAGSYTLTFTASAPNGSRQLEAVVQLGDEPYTDYGKRTVSLTSSDQTFTVPITVPSNVPGIPGAQVAFNLGSGLGSGNVIISNVSLTAGRTSVRHSAVKVYGTAARAVVKPVSGGLTAALPADHKYTSYKLIDLQGREIKRGKIAAGVTDLRVSNIKSGVVFLRLEGRGAATEVLRAMAAR